MSETIFEVLESGPIVAGDDDMGYLVTINGSYLNLWSSIVESRGPGRAEAVVWRSIDCRATNLPEGLYKLSAAEALDMGKAWLDEILSDLQDQGAEDES
jgi:hypothetical protein